MSPEGFIQGHAVFEAARSKIGAPMPSGITRRNAVAARLFGKLIVDYSEDTRRLRLGLCGSKAAESRVEAIGEAILAKMSDMERKDGADSPRSRIIKGPENPNGQRLPWTIAGIVLGFLVPIVVAFVWARHRSARNRLPYGLA